MILVLHPERIEEGLAAGDVVAFRRRFTTSSAATWSLVTMFTSGRLLDPTAKIH